LRGRFTKTHLKRIARAEELRRLLPQSPSLKNDYDCESALDHSRSSRRTKSSKLQTATAVVGFTANTNSYRDSSCEGRLESFTTSRRWQAAAVMGNEERRARTHR
jgi:hypothetical protein